LCFSGISSHKIHPPQSEYCAAHRLSLEAPCTSLLTSSQDLEFMV
jgi:hypothetical protein